MSRPAPKVIAELVNKKTFKSDQILEAEAIWAVFYQGKPFNLKNQPGFSNNADSKYKKTSFPNPGHAINLAKKLNDQFKTNDFAVFKLTTGEELK
jgi:hypothetical protein